MSRLLLVVVTVLALFRVAYADDRGVADDVRASPIPSRFTIPNAYAAVLDAGVEARRWQAALARLDANRIRSTASEDAIQPPLLPTASAGAARMKVTVSPTIISIGAKF